MSAWSPASSWMVVRSLFALHDVIILGYLVVIRGLLVVSAGLGIGGGGDVQGCASAIDACLVVLLVACAIYRGPFAFDRIKASHSADDERLRRAVALARHAYCAALGWVVVQNYVVLRDLLPLLRADSVDATLLAIDRALFGVEPALYLERFNIPVAVEWFSFFYFSYFFICAAYLVGILWLVRADRFTTEFAIGSLLVVCIGQLGYIAVPGYGPVRHLEPEFAGPLQGGFFFECVMSTVQSAGAMKDIFPSLHTALPCWFTMHALRRSRVERRWRFVAVLTGFFAINIVISTMFLRWHYAIDVIAGLVLAGAAAALAPRLAKHDESWRRARGMGAPFTINRSLGNGRSR